MIAAVVRTWLAVVVRTLPAVVGDNRVGRFDLRSGVDLVMFVRHDVPE